MLSVDRYTPSAGGTNTAVMIGIVNVDYLRLSLQMSEHLIVSAFTAPGLALGVASGRLSFTFALTGPSASLDTACSSSLVGTHGAVSCIERSESEDAVCGGVNLTLTPAVTTMFNRSGMMALDGRCKALDARADGYVRGEGLMMMRLAANMNEGSVAKLGASIINQDGASSALTAPNGPSQASAILAGGCYGCNDVWWTPCDTSRTLDSARFSHILRHSATQPCM